MANLSSVSWLASPFGGNLLRTPHKTCWCSGNEGTRERTWGIPQKPNRKWMVFLGLISSLSPCISRTDRKQEVMNVFQHRKQKRQLASWWFGLGGSVVKEGFPMYKNRDPFESQSKVPPTEALIQNRPERVATSWGDPHVKARASNRPPCLAESHGSPAL